MSSFTTKTARLVSIALFGTLCYAGIGSLSPPSAPNLSERYPPIVDMIWVQKLKTPTPNGEDLIFRVRYILDQKLPSSLTVYLDTKTKVILHDDGVAPDTKASDQIFSAYVDCDTDALSSSLLRFEDQWRRKEKMILFKGHVGEFVPFDQLTRFDKQSFDQNKEVEVDQRLLDAEECNAELLRERSLFITDIAVVKDASRTYDPVTGIGNPDGAWTFGTLMNNINNGQHPQGTRGLLKDFVRHWVYAQTVNGASIPPRDFVIETLIEPWLRKANADPSLIVSVNDWEATWEATAEEDLRRFAPFRMSAIVNRIDLRGNSAYSSTLQGTGETRFIFSLIDPFTGAIPINPNQSASAGQNGVGFVDWRGLNVIFEYENVQTTRCGTRDLAQQWLDLSDGAYQFGNSETDNPYKVALQAITDLVTSANAAPDKTNGSALGRIRTNEKVFAPFVGAGTSEAIWERQDWEFRQLELNAASHSLTLVPLTNTPPHSANHAPNIEEDYSTANPPVTNSDLLNWIYSGNRHRVLNGNFNLPSNLLTGSGMVRREQAQYFDFAPSAFQVVGGYTPDVPSAEAKMIRHQLSLNTCAGCHTGETKTVFTQVNTLNNVEEAKYWNTTLDGAADIPQDGTLYPWGGTDPLQLGGGNVGNTLDDYLNAQIQNLQTEPHIDRRDFFQHVSPFLTGRRYVEYVAPEYGDPSWEDDEEDNGNTFAGNFEELDSGIEGLFYVNDPSNNLGDEFPYVGDRKNGFNDLHRRKEDICTFLNQDCLGTPVHPVVKMIALIRFVPLPEAGH